LTGTNYFIASPLVARLNPIYFLRNAVGKRGGNKFLVEIFLVKSVYEKNMKLEKVNNFRDNKALGLNKQNSKK